MRKTIITFGILAFFAMCLNAQQPIEKSPWYIGFNGGMLFGNIANTSYAYILTDKSTFQTGGLLGYKINEEFGVQLELMFERRKFQSERYITGFKLVDTSAFVCWDCYYAYNVNFSSDYLTFPLVLNYSKMKYRFGLAVQTGLYYSFLLVNNYDGYEELFLDPIGAISFIEYDFEPGMYRVIFSGPSSDLMSKYDAGLILGLSGIYELNKNINLTMDARLQLSFVGMYENPQMAIINYKCFVIRAGMTYKLNKKY